MESDETAETGSAIKLERDGALTVLSIESPPLNLFDEQLMGDLERAIASLAAAHRAVY